VIYITVILKIGGLEDWRIGSSKVKFALQILLLFIDSGSSSEWHRRDPASSAGWHCWLCGM